MPLHGDEPRRPAALDRFDDAVGRDGGHREAGSQVRDRLVVAAVDGQLDGGGDPRELRSRLDPNGVIVLRLVPALLLVGLVGERAGSLGGRAASTTVTPPDGPARSMRISERAFAAAAARAGSGSVTLISKSSEFGGSLTSTSGTVPGPRRSASSARTGSVPRRSR